MTFTRTMIANAALAKCGDLRISSYESDYGTAADAVRDHYELAVRYTLEAHSWQFASEYAELVSEGTPPVSEYSAKWLLPSDFCRLNRVSAYSNFTPTLTEWVVKGRYLYTSSDYAFIDYVRYTDNESEYTAMFVDSLSYKLASLISQFIHGSSGNRQGLEKDFLESLRVSRSVASTQQPSRDPIRSRFKSARFGR